jgi:hypothetical protein
MVAATQHADDKLVNVLAPETGERAKSKAIAFNVVSRLTGAVPFCPPKVGFGTASVEHATEHFRFDILDGCEGVARSNTVISECSAIRSLDHHMIARACRCGVNACTELRPGAR